MKKTKHISLYEYFSFKDSGTRGSSLDSGSKDYTKGVICIADYGGGGLAVGTINSRSDAAYIQELEQYVPKDNVYGKDYADQISIQVIPGTGDGDNEFVCFEDGGFDIYGAGDNFKVPSGGYVFTIPNGSFLVLTDGYNQYELLTAKQVRDWFGR